MVCRIITYCTKNSQKEFTTKKNIAHVLIDTTITAVVSSIIAVVGMTILLSLNKTLANKFFEAIKVPLKDLNAKLLLLIGSGVGVGSLGFIGHLAIEIIVASIKLAIKKDIKEIKNDEVVKVEEDQLLNEQFPKNMNVDRMNYLREKDILIIRTKKAENLKSFEYEKNNSQECEAGERWTSAAFKNQSAHFSEGKKGVGLILDVLDIDENGFFIPKHKDVFLTERYGYTAATDNFCIRSAGEKAKISEEKNIKASPFEGGRVLHIMNVRNNNNHFEEVIVLRDEESHLDDLKGLFVFNIEENGIDTKIENFKKIFPKLPMFTQNEFGKIIEI
jgi:hypothetical protein